MPDTSTPFTSKNLELPYIAPAQAQKHVTVNEALRILDAVVQLSVLDKDLSTPPASPNEGDRYIVAAGGTGEWAGADNKIAAFLDGAWMVITPLEGWIVYIADEQIQYIFDGTEWSDYWSSALSGLDTNNVRFGELGLGGATADATNVLSVNGPAALFNNAGNGVQFKLNKNATTDTASFLFQTGFSGRAEIGLTGDDDFSFKVSPDGSAFYNAIIVDNSTGAVRLPSGMEHHISREPIANLLLTPGGTGEVSIWEMGAVRSGLPRQATLSAIAADKITFTDTVADQFFQNNTMEGVSYVRIWNISKNPREYAWIRARGTTSELYVKDAATIAGWTSGDTIQIGEPVGTVNGLNTTNQIVAIDISQMQQAFFGVTFPQKALLVSAGISGTGAVGWDNHMGFTADGSGGSFSAVFTQVASVLTSVELTIGITQLSDISNSNLLFVRERTANGGQISSASVRVKGIYV